MGFVPFGTPYCFAYRMNTHHFMISLKYQNDSYKAKDIG